MTNFYRMSLSTYITISPTILRTWIKCPPLLTKSVPTFLKGNTGIACLHLSTDSNAQRKYIQDLEKAVNQTDNTSTRYQLFHMPWKGVRNIPSVSSNPLPNCAYDADIVTFSDCFCLISAQSFSLLAFFYYTCCFQLTLSQKLTKN